MIPRQFSLSLVALIALATTACSQGESVVGGPTDAGSVVDLGATDVGSAMDVVDVPPAADTPPAVDVPVDAPFRCARNEDCAGRAEGAACDVASGRCVACVPTADTCPAGQFCVAGSNTCAPGCRNDEGCSSAATDAGAGPGRRCDLTTRACVDCLTNDHCPSGTLCVGNLCVMGCSAERGCPSGQACCTGACVDTQSNTAACGACERRCTIAGGSASCLNGMCTVGTCTAPNADCDRDATNGCETNTQSDLAHCGACMRACPVPANATASCAGGVCGSTCLTGFADCDGDASNGCEVDTRTSGSHCGACNRGCAPPNATGACVASVCTVASCATGFGDCDGNASNGCEVDTRTNASHCAACNMACPAPANSVPACVGSTCLRTCAVGFDDCDLSDANGCEVNLRTSNTHCGRCGQACSLANASATCVSGTCSLTMCAAGFGDCDGTASNGCEVDTRSSALHCGGCARPCTAPANASPVCRDGACGFACNAGFGDCDGNAANGCEVDLSTSTAHCGRCASVCGSGVCRGGACQAPSCTDRVRNGTETDVDCGGSCPGCALCQGCATNGDCTSGTCNSTGRCTFRTEVSIPWLASCHGPDNSPVDVVVPGVPAGDYQVTALPSGGTVWSAVSLPGQGWFWYITCQNLSVPGLATPAGTYYATPEAAFAALPRTTSTATFAGGTLTCFFSDSACADNRGSTRFSMERTCP